MTWARACHSASCCVEVLTWTKSETSGANDCVEVSCHLGEGHVHVRDSKDPDGPVLTFTVSEWVSFVQGVKADQPGLVA